MEVPVILETGPLVAYLDKREEHHEWAVEWFGRMDDAVWTCEAVLTEACFLLAHLPAAHDGVGELVRRGIVEVRFDLQENHASVFELMKKCHDVPMALADACLVRMAEETHGSRVFTVDSDFHVYRMRGRKAVPLICPD